MPQLHFTSDRLKQNKRQEQRQARYALAQFKEKLKGAKQKKAYAKPPKKPQPAPSSSRNKHKKNKHRPAQGLTKTQKLLLLILFMSLFVPVARAEVRNGRETKQNRNSGLSSKELEQKYIAFNSSSLINHKAPMLSNPFGENSQPIPPVTNISQCHLLWSSTVTQDAHKTREHICIRKMGAPDNAKFVDAVRMSNAAANNHNESYENVLMAWPLEQRRKLLMEAISHIDPQHNEEEISEGLPALPSLEINSEFDYLRLSPHRQDIIAKSLSTDFEFQLSERVKMRVDIVSDSESLTYVELQKALLQAMSNDNVSEFKRIVELGIRLPRIKVVTTNIDPNTNISSTLNLKRDYLDRLNIIGVAISTDALKILDYLLTHRDAFSFSPQDLDFALRTFLVTHKGRAIETMLNSGINFNVDILNYVMANLVPDGSISLDVIKNMVRHGADPNASTRDQIPSTALINAIIFHRPDILRYFLSISNREIVRSFAGLLHEAVRLAMKGDRDNAVVEVLVQHDPSLLNFRDESGRRPIELVVGRQFNPLIRLLSTNQSLDSSEPFLLRYMNNIGNVASLFAKAVLAIVIIKLFISFTRVFKRKLRTVHFLNPIYRRQVRRVVLIENPEIIRLAQLTSTLIRSKWEESEGKLVLDLSLMEENKKQALTLVLLEVYGEGQVNLRGTRLIIEPTKIMLSEQQIPDLLDKFYQKHAEIIQAQEHASLLEKKEKLMNEISMLRHSLVSVCQKFAPDYQRAKSRAENSENSTVRKLANNFIKMYEKAKTNSDKDTEKIAIVPNAPLLAASLSSPTSDVLMKEIRLLQEEKLQLDSRIKQLPELFESFNYACTRSGVSETSVSTPVKLDKTPKAAMTLFPSKPVAKKPTAKIAPAASSSDYLPKPVAASSSAKAAAAAASAVTIVLAKNFSPSMFKARPVSEGKKEKETNSPYVYKKPQSRSHLTQAQLEKIKAEIFEKMRELIKEIEQYDFASSGRIAFRHALSYYMLRLFHCMWLQKLADSPSPPSDKEVDIKIIRHMLAHLPAAASDDLIVMSAIDVCAGKDASELYLGLKRNWEAKEHQHKTADECIAHIRECLNALSNAQKIIDSAYALSKYPVNRDAMRMLIAILGDYLTLLRDHHDDTWKRLLFEDKDKLLQRCIELRNAVYHDMDKEISIETVFHFALRLNRELPTLITNLSLQLKA